VQKKLIKLGFAAKMSFKTTFEPLSNETWPSFEKLFGPKGACAGCWCMTWRLQKADYERHKGDGNKKAIKKLASKNEPIGIIAFINDEPAGWCAVAPREKYVRLQTSRVLKPIDDQPVWSISCLFIAKPFRRQGLSIKLLNATVAYAKKQGAKIVEGYPLEPKDNKMPDVFAWTGILSSFIAAGFKEENRHSESRPIVRFYLE
jgi:GNAT superfamily N-acetyltransferase